MGAKHVNPTRMELTRPKKKLATAIRGYKLLKDKWDELMRQLPDLMCENKVLHEKVEVRIAVVSQSFVLARPGMMDGDLNMVLMAPKQEVYLESETGNVMSVGISALKYKTRTSGPNDIYSYGFAFTSNDLDDTVKSLTDLLPDMPRLTECEKSCQLMTAEVEKTRRRVNALEHVIIPEIQQNIRYTTVKLDGNERSSQTRLMKVKDMMFEEAHHYSEREVAPVVDEV